MKNETKTTSFRTTQSIINMLEEVCNIEHRTKGKTLELMIIKYYKELKEKQGE